MFPQLNLNSVATASKGELPSTMQPASRRLAQPSVCFSSPFVVHDKHFLIDCARTTRTILLADRPGGLSDSFDCFDCNSRKQDWQHCRKKLQLTITRRSRASAQKSSQNSSQVLDMDLAWQEYKHTGESIKDSQKPNNHWAL